MPNVNHLSIEKHMHNSLVCGLVNIEGVLGIQCVHDGAFRKRSQLPLWKALRSGFSRS